ncbi:MAG: MFS transporter [Actinobacteria bacterium]|nr:MFS transporter [Actinomycetota bacterium]
MEQLTPATLRSRAGFTATLAGAMAAGTLVAPALAVLASFVIGDVGLSRSQLGLVMAAYYGVAAVGSPSVGRLADRFGGRRLLVGTFLLSAAGFLVVAAAPGLLLLLAGAAIGGLGQAAANPSTNKLLSVHVAPGQRGLITGLKQSGVQAGVFVAGMALPTLALAFGWRAAMAGVGLLFLAAAAVVRAVVPADPAAGPAEPRHRSDRGSLPPAVMWLAAYGGLMGAGAGAVTAYLPLYAEEGLGLSVTVAGAVAGVSGAVGFVSRITWSTVSERGATFSRPLGAIALLATVSAAGLMAAPAVGVWLLWVAAVVHATSGLAWNSVGMLAVMHVAGNRQAGRASGIVLLGFLAGFSIGPPLFGWSVDTTGSYAAGLAVVVLAFAAAGIVMLRWSRVYVADQAA